MTKHLQGCLAATCMLLLPALAAASGAGAKFGVQIAAEEATYEEVAETFRLIESLGYDSAWLNDHLLPSAGDEDGAQFESWTTLAALATLSGGAAEAESHRLSGTLTNTAVDDGVKAYFKLIGPDEACTDPGPGRYAGQASFREGQADYALEGVAAGEYTVCFFIDSDDNIATTQSPTSGDYGAIKPVNVTGDTALDVKESEWGRIP